MSVVASNEPTNRLPDYTDLINRLGALNGYSKEVEMGLRLEAMMALEDLSARLRDLSAHSVPAPRVSMAALNWLAHGARGISSNTIFSHLTGIDALHGSPASHPHDPADFRRCRLLLDQVPELQVKFAGMASVSGVWRELVGAWGELCAIMDDESPRWRDGEGRGVRLNERMRELISAGHKSTPVAGV